MNDEFTISNDKLISNFQLLNWGLVIGRACRQAGILLGIGIWLLVIAHSAFAATSANYAISAEVIDLGGASMESSTYNMFGNLREIGPDVTTSSTYTLEGRFVGMVYGTGTYSTFEMPVLTSIDPNSGYNDTSYTIFIKGTTISFDATAKLYKSGQTPIDPVAGTVTYETPASMECTFNLAGAALGQWDLRITNTGFGRTSLITAADIFTISSRGETELIGTPVNDPNPFDPSVGPTHIKYTLRAAGTITLYVFNQRGERVWEKTYGPTENGGMAGDNDPTWDGLSQWKEGVPTGVYIVLIVKKSGGVAELTDKGTRIKVIVLRK